MNPIAVVLFIVLLLILIGALPGVGPVAHNWGYWPSGGVGLLLLIVLILVLAGRL